MDHLPETSPGSKKPIEVPCLCSPHSYDGLGFDEFPIRGGWTVDRKEYTTLLMRSDGAADSPTETSKFLQAWLFFGMLVEVFRAVNILVNPQEFVRDGSDGRFVTTHQLPTYLSQWVAKAQTLDEKVRKKQCRNASEILQKVLYFANANFTATTMVILDSETLKSRAGLAIELSIFVLVETLERTASYIQSKFGSIRSVSPEYNLSDIDVAVSLKQTMLKNGWCRSSISMLSLTLGNTGMYFASRLRQRARGRDHESCSDTKCVTSFIDENTYQTQHTKDCSGCQHVGVDVEHLAATLRDGKLPSIAISVRKVDHDGNKHCVEALEVVSDQTYVAISHVWSDGLGNTQNNSLPTCQLLRLRDVTAAIYRTSGSHDCTLPTYPSIWIDTLCVPLEASARKLALVRLAESYAAADTVLVLDSELQETSINTCQEEQLCRICLSQWLRRLWTSEEGVIGRAKLRFQLQEASIVAPQVKGDSFHSIGENAMALIQYCLPNITGNKVTDKSLSNKSDPNDAENPRDITSILMATQFRSTTKLIDESLCLAHILGLDARELVHEHSEPQRMKKFLLLLAARRIKLPFTFLFTTEPKLQIDGFRWAPASFMTLKHGDVHYILEHQTKAWSYFNERGIQAAGLTGHELEFGTEILKKVVFFLPPSGVWHVVVPVPAQGFASKMADRYWTREVAGEAFSVEPERDWPDGWKCRYRTSPTGLVLLGTGLGASNTERSLMVSRYDADDDNADGRLYARVVGQVMVFALRASVFRNGALRIVDEEVPSDSSTDIIEMLRTRSTAAFKEEFSKHTCSLAVMSQRIENKLWCIG